jgi:hypothetical protein
MWLRETVPIVNTRMSRSLPTALAAYAHQAEGQCLLEGQTSNIWRKEPKAKVFQQ